MCQKLFPQPNMLFAIYHFAIGISQCSIGTVILLMDAGCFMRGGTGIGIFPILAGAFGIVGSLRQVRGYIITTMVLSIIICVVLLAYDILLFSYTYTTVNFCLPFFTAIVVLETILSGIQAGIAMAVACPKCCCETLEPTGNVQTGNPLSVSAGDVVIEQLPEAPGRGGSAVAFDGPRVVIQHQHM